MSGDEEAANPPHETGGAVAAVCRRYSAPPLLARVAHGDGASFERAIRDVIGPAKPVGGASSIPADMHGGTLCHYAALAGRVDWLEQCRNAATRVWEQAPVAKDSGATIAHYAAAGGHVHALDWIANAMGADFLRLKRTDGVSVALTAGLHGHPRALAYLRDTVGLAADILPPIGAADAKEFAKSAWGLAHAVCLSGSVECVDIVADALGADAFRADCRDFATIYAAQKGHVHILERLRGRIGNECLLWTHPSSGGTILHTAAKYGHLNVFDFVYEHVGSRLLDSPSADYAWTVAHGAADSGSVGILRHIVEKSSLGVSALRARNRSRATPALLAAQHGHIDALLFIVDALGVDAVLGVQDDDVERSVLHYAARSGKVDLLRRIGDTYGDALLRQTLPNGMTIAHAATTHGHIGVLTFVRDRLGVDFLLNATRRGAGVAHMAASEGHLAVLRLLVTAVGVERALLPRLDRGGTVADMAAMYGRVAVLQWLLNEGSRASNELVGAACNDVAVLGKAAARGHLNVVRFASVHAGARVLTRPDAAGWGVLHRAVAAGHADIVDVVVAACGADALGVASASHLFVPRLAARCGHLEILKRVASAKPSFLKMAPGGVNIAHDAAAGGHVHVLRWIATEMQGGRALMALDATSSMGSIVHTAASWGKVQVLEYVEEEFCPGGIRAIQRRHDGDGTSRGRSLALEAVARRGHVAVLEYLEHASGGPEGIAGARHTGAGSVASVSAEGGYMHALRYLASATERCSNDATLAAARWQ